MNSYGPRSIIQKPSRGEIGREEILAEVKRLTDKQELLATKSISVDTLHLSLQIPYSVLYSLISELATDGLIVFEAPQGRSRRTSRLGNIRLVA